MGRPQLSYGRRGRLSGADAGIRRVAPSFGKALYLTYSAKTNGLFAIESDAERLVANMLTLDPRVASFRPQPFRVDLLDQRILRTADAIAEARQKHKSREGAKFYTPDFEVVWLDRTRSIFEVKVEGYEGDGHQVVGSLEAVAECGASGSEGTARQCCARWAGQDLFVSAH